MENATKALLIAGSVLIAIVLIAIGMRILSSTQGATDAAEETMSASEIAIFNNKFSQYYGTGKSKSEVIALINTIVANNSVSNSKVTLQIISTSYTTDQLNNGVATNNLIASTATSFTIKQGSQTNGRISSILVTSP